MLWGPLRFFIAVCLLGLLSSTETIAAPKAKLTASYRDFLNGPASLLLTRAEKKAFQSLQTDPERDNFLERFWEIRNPAPGSASNEFKEEFYRRVAYANSFYGRDSGSAGWRTDRGRTYILFGRPQTSMNYLGNQELYPTELWFYSNPGLAELPPFFYVLFFEGDGVSGYHFYYPYVDSPDKLLRSGGQSKQAAYQYLHNISAEMANATLSWIPGEPIDTQTFSGSMASMQIVNAIQGYAEMPSYAHTISTREQRLERVTSKVEYKLARTDLLTFVAMENGKSWLHWRMEVNDPAQPKWITGQAKLHVVSRLFSHGQLVMEQSDDPAFTVPEANAEQIRKRPLSYEDLLPVEAGQYQLAVAITNEQSGTVYEASRDFTVKPTEDRTGISDVLVIAKHAPDPRRRAFTFGGVQFQPSAQNYVKASEGLSLLYQIQLPAERPTALEVHYAVGQVASTVKKTFDEKLNMAQADQAGSLLTAKTLPIQELAPGQYRLSIRVEDPNSKKISAAAIPFVVASESLGLPPVVIARGINMTPQGQAAVHYERALCLLSQNRASEAVEALKESWELSRNAQVKTLLEHLSSSSTAVAGKTKTAE